MPFRYYRRFGWKRLRGRLSLPVGRGSPAVTFWWQRRRRRKRR